MNIKFILAIFLFILVNSSFSQTKNEWSYSEIINSISDFDSFNELILRDKEYYQQNTSNTNFFVNGENSVLFDRDNGSVKFFFSPNNKANYEKIIELIKANNKKKDFGLKETSDGKFYVSTYISKNHRIEIYTGYKGNRYLIIYKNQE